ncbi:hypothetical protein CSX04_05480 [Burkholderia cepacia]|nr:hypothetical protein CSX04_05480 [Burkholderia cepacia]
MSASSPNPAGTPGTDTTALAAGDPAAAAPAAPAAHAPHPHGKMLHPVVMMLWVLAAAIALTWLVDSGQFARDGRLVVPGTYHVVPKTTALTTLVAPAVSHSTSAHALPASLVSAFVAVPQGC